MLWTHLGKCLVLSSDGNSGKPLKVHWLGGFGAYFPFFVKLDRHLKAQIICYECKQL